MFDSIFSRHFPKQLIEEVSETVFSSEVVREQLKATVVFAPLKDARGETCDKYIVLRLTQFSSFRNITGHDIEDFEIKFGYPFPGNPNYRNQAKIVSVAIDNIQLTSDEIEAGDRAAPDTPDRRRYLWHRRLRANGRLEMAITWEMVKERSDTEVWRSLYPSMQIQLDVAVPMGDLEFGAHSLHRKELTPRGDSTGGFRSWSLDHPLLPHQAVVLWWRPRIAVEGDEARPGTQRDDLGDKS